MEALFEFIGLKSRRHPPPKVETDDIYPTHFFDDQPSNCLVVGWTMRFNDVLDAELLRDAAVQVLCTGDWRKLGGRFRKNKDGRLEIHVPKEFTAERPALRYSRDIHDLSIDEHPLGRQLPKPTSSISVQPGPTSFASFTTPAKNVPKSLDDFIYSDEPLLGLHITSFKDATLVALAFHHMASDAAGMASFVAAWSRVLAGQKDAIPELRGARHDDLSPLGANDPDPQPSIHESMILRGFGFVRFLFLLLWEVVWNPTTEQRMMFLPAPFLAKLRSEAQAQLVAGIDEKSPFISEGDLIIAWATSQLMLARGEKRPATIMNAFNIRNRMPRIFDAGGVYVQNVSGIVCTILSTVEVAQESLGRAALKLRRAIAAQATEAQTRAYIRLCLREMKNGQLPLFGHPSGKGLLIFVTNWTQTRIVEGVDFSPAVIRSVPREAWPRTEPGRVTYHHAHWLENKAINRNIFMIPGKDVEGNYWVTGILSKADWKKMEKCVMDFGP